MASVTVSLSSVQADQREKTRKRCSVGRRGLFLSVMFTSSATLTSQANDSKTDLLQKYLKKSEENKEKNDKQRRDDYYKRNYKDYFQFIEGSLEGKTEEQLTQAEKKILEWLKTNK